MHLIFIACNKNTKNFLTDPSFIYRCENLAYGVKCNGNTSELIHLKKFSLLNQADVVIFHRPKFTLRLYFTIKVLKLQKKNYMLDIDDYIFNPQDAKESPAYKNSILTLKQIKKQFKSNLKALKLFTNFSVSTQPLEEHIRKIIPLSNIIITPNAVHHTWKKINTQKLVNGNKIISYFPGTKSHDKDFLSIVNPLTKFLQKHPDIHLQITGPLNFKLDVPKEQIIHNNKVPFEQHWKNYQNIWMNLAPLEKTPFNECKSALKIIEAGYFSIPTLSIDNPDTQRFRDSGAIITNNENDFFDSLEKCLDDKYYAEITNNLQEKVLEIANVQIIAKNLIQFITDTQPIKFARQRRKEGIYNYSTLKLYKQAWIQTKDKNIYVEYCMFCRDLGYTLSLSRQKVLQHFYHQLTFKSKSNAKLLLNETKNNYDLKDTFLKKIFQHQSTWVNLFTQEVKNKNICVVGNSATIKGKKLGQHIDSHDEVIRFNNCCSKINNDDLGNKTDIWVSAPNVKNIISTKWTIVSGPNMLYRGANWSRFKNINFQTHKILSVPLEIWKYLVYTLQAPPSAGVLILYWLKTLLEDWENISIVGFDLKMTTDVYHYTDDKHQAGSRHNWKKEKELLNQWVQEGLKVIK